MKTHWKKAFNPEYMGAFSFNEGEREKIVKIKSVSEAVEITGDGGRKEIKPVVFFEGQHLPLILNRTNSKAITAAVGSPFFEDWAGKSISLYVAQVKAFGDVIDAVRVKSIAPAIRKKKLSEERFRAMVDQIKAGKFTIDQAKERFDLAKNQLKTLEEIK